MIKKVIDVYGREVEIRENLRKLYSYNNMAGEITYNAPIVEDGELTGFWTEYKESGTIDSAEERLKVWNNKVLLLYAASVGFKASENDPDRKKYNKIVEYVKNNQEMFFTKTGDFRKKFLVSDKDILDLLKSI